MNRTRTLAVSVAALASAGALLATVDVATASPAPAAPHAKACAESQLRAKAVPMHIAGLKEHVVQLRFGNTSKRTCTLSGYPGAAIVDSHGKQVKQAKRVYGGAIGGTIERPRTVTLRPGKSAYAWLDGRSTQERGAAQAGCDAKYPRILVTPPNTSRPVSFTVGWPLCHTFEVHPVRVD